ncbi:MAG: class I SAM-dependent methyltransferase [Alphaproteobacteria bacterium]
MPVSPGSSLPLYDRIGRTYDYGRRADARITGPLAEHLGPPEAGAVIDVGCGTGNYTAALAARGYRITGLDISPHMLGKARAKSPETSFVRGSAMCLPFGDGAFPRAMCTLAAHHFPGKTAAFREVRRVLNTGPFVLFTAFAGQMERYWLKRYFPQTMARALRQMGSEAEWRAALAAAGFGEVESFAWEVPEDLADLFWYSGKHRPELYFDPAVRAGISAFANLADEAEVAAGLARLRADLDSGAFAEVLAEARHEGGDYAFVVARPAV